MKISEKDLSRAVDALLAGEVVVMPTDTVYGVCARAQDEQAVQKLYALKR
ncbi:Sua5/YciO/YrdC/YwlC family protein [Candidatus Saccharibacteria bacterium]|nr:Sua5/YciO/YrdC/YwlC family protein [Candidatus Saccharibacteria bacterium]